MTLLRRFGIYSIIGTISLMPLLVLPAMIGTLVDETTLSEAQAGWSASVNFFGGAAAALLMALRMHRLDLRRVAVLAFALAALALTAHLPGRAIDPSNFHGVPSELHVLLAGATLLGALGFAIFEAANTAQFTYLERLGVSLTLSEQQIGSALLIASLAGIPGAFAIVLLDSRLGRMAARSPPARLRQPSAAPSGRGWLPWHSVVGRIPVYWGFPCACC